MTKARSLQDLGPLREALREREAEMARVRMAEEAERRQQEQQGHRAPMHQVPVRHHLDQHHLPPWMDLQKARRPRGADLRGAARLT